MGNYKTKIKNVAISTLTERGKKMSESLLKVNNIEVVYNHVILALRGVTLDVEEGKVVFY